MKGSMLDIVGVVTIVFFFSVCAIMGWMILDKFETSTAFTTSGMNATIIDNAKSAQGVWDWGIIFILFGSMLFTLIAAYQVDTHPALFVFGILVFMITLIIAMIVSNAFYAFYNSASISSYTGSFPNLIYTMNHLVEILMVFGAVLLIVLYGKIRNVGGGGNV